jgi:hypothetical protein
VRLTSPSRPARCKSGQPSERSQLLKSTLYSDFSECTRQLTFERVQDLERVFPELLYTGGAGKGFKYKTAEGQEKVVNDDEVQILRCLYSILYTR